MGLTFLSTAKGYVSSPSGETDPDALTKIVNAIRQEWYSWYEDLPLFRFVQECFELQRFPIDCRAGCDTYLGFALPNDYANIEALWYDDRRVEFHDRWRQWQYGMTNPCDCGLKAVEVGRYSTERDLRVGYPSKIMFTALDPRDSGKLIEIRGLTVAGVPFYERYELAAKPQCTPSLLAFLTQQGGVTKDMTIGRVAVAEEATGRILSILGPHDLIPQVRRYKITGVPNECSAVNVRATRNYTALFDDHDVVETDNERAWAAMARAQRLDAKAVKTGDDLRTISADKGLAKQLLRGDNSRAVGRSIQVDIRVPAPPIGRGRHRLNRNSSSRW